MKVEDYIASGVLEQYVLGELSEEREAEVMSYAQRYPEVRTEIDLIEESLEEIARSLAIQPRKQVWDKIANKINDEKRDSQDKKSKKINFLRYGVAATFTLKLMFMAVAAHFWINWQHSESRLEKMQTRYDQLEQQTRQLSQAFAIVNNPSFQTLLLKSNEENDAINPILYWNEGVTQVYVNPNALPANDEAQQYQLWATVEGKPQSLGVFDVSSDSFPQMIMMKGISPISSFIITLEPKGGSEQPNQQARHYSGPVE